MMNALISKWPTDHPFCVWDICHLEAPSTIITSIRLASHTAHINPLALSVSARFCLCIFLFCIFLHKHASALIHKKAAANVSVSLIVLISYYMHWVRQESSKVFDLELWLECCPKLKAHRPTLSGLHPPASVWNFHSQNPERNQLCTHKVPSHSHSHSIRPIHCRHYRP